MLATNNIIVAVFLMLGVSVQSGCSDYGAAKELAPGPVGAVLIRQWTTNAASVNAIAVSPEGKHIAVGRETGQVDVWNTASGDKPEDTFSDSQNPVRSIAYSPDGRFLAWVAEGPEAPSMNPKYVASIFVHDFENKKTASIHQEGGYPYDASLAFSADSRYLWLFIETSLDGSDLAILDPKTLTTAWRHHDASYWPHHFYCGSDHPQLAAFGQMFDLADPTGNTSGTLSYPPDAISFDSHAAYFSWPPQYVHWFGEKDPGTLWRDGGVEVADLMRKNPKAFLRFAGAPTAYLEGAEFVRNGPAAPDGWLLGQLRTPTDRGDMPIIIDLHTKHYQSLCPPGTTRGVSVFAAAGDGRTVALASVWGVVVWSLPVK